MAAVPSPTRRNVWVGMARNQRLYEAIRQSGRRLDNLAEEVGADAKTVERWITTGRLPRAASREQVARVLNVPQSILWPEAPGAAYGTSELVGIYTTRSELSPATISSLLDVAEEHVDVLAYAALWLWDSVPGFAERLAAKASNGTQVRVCLGNPESAAVALRGQEEGVRDGMAGRCRLAAAYAEPVQAADPEAVRITGATLYNSIFRFDDQVLVNAHVWGHPASESPLFHYHQHGDRGIAAHVMHSFDLVWGDAQPSAAG
jgi:hypothetical protein